LPLPHQPQRTRRPQRLQRNFFVLRLLHIRRIAPKPAPSAGINCTWYNYFPLFRLQPSFGLTPRPMHRTQKYVYYTLSNSDSQVLFEKFVKFFLPQRRKGRKDIFSFFVFLFALADKAATTNKGADPLVCSYWGIACKALSGKEINCTRYNYFGRNGGLHG